MASKDPSQDKSVEMTYFNNGKTHPEVCGYDIAFHYEDGYNQKLKREDQHHTQVGATLAGQGGTWSGVSLKCTIFGIFSLTHSQEVVWPGNPYFFWGGGGGGG